MGAARNHRDVMTDRCEQYRQMAPDRACSHHTNTHVPASPEVRAMIAGWRMTHRTILARFAAPSPKKTSMEYGLRSNSSTVWNAAW
jgi:hypothetical protein